MNPYLKFGKMMANVFSQRHGGNEMHACDLCKHIIGFPGTFVSFEEQNPFALVEATTCVFFAGG